MSTGEHHEPFEAGQSSVVADYTKEMLSAAYELGRLYFESGYFVPAERIFSGLAAVDRGLTPSRVGLGLIRLEKGQFQEAGGEGMGRDRSGREGRRSARRNARHHGRRTDQAQQGPRRRVRP